MIGVEDRTCVLDLVSNMRKLRALNVLCADDTTHEQSISKYDELIDWLREHLIPTCSLANILRIVFIHFFVFLYQQTSYWINNWIIYLSCKSLIDKYAALKFCIINQLSTYLIWFYSWVFKNVLNITEK